MALNEFKQEECASTRGPGQRAGIVVAAVAVSSAIAMILAAAGLPWSQAAGLPPLLLGLALVAWNTHAALCFTAFAIAPLGVVQAEVLGVTLNLPEVLILALVAKEGLRALRERQPLPAALPVRTLAVFAIAAAIALATGLIQQNGVVRVLQDCRQFTEFLLLFWLVLQRVSGRDEAVRIAACYAAGATLLAIHGIIQQIVPVGISPTQISSDLVLHQGIRSGSFYGATTLGGLMVLAVAPAAGVALSSRRRSVQILMGLCILLCVIAIIFTRTRGSWLGLAVALALIGVSVRPSGKTLAAVAFAGVALALVLGPVVVQRLYTLADPEQDISLMARAQYYAAAARIGQAHPVLGLGWGCYFDVDAILQAGEYVKVPFVEAVASGENMKGIDRHEPPGEATVHSAYLQLFVKTGILGLGAFLALIVVWLERVWRGRNTRFQRDGVQALFIGITAGIAGYLFHSTFENFFQWPVMAQSFWLLFGLSFVLAPEPARAPRYGLPLAFVASAVAVFLMFMYICLRLETYHTDHYERNVAKALEDGDLEKALHIARRATEVELYEPMPFTVYARLLLQQGDTEAALAALETAFGTVERPPAPRVRFTGARYYFAPARLTLGQYHAGRGEWDQALHQFELARAYADLTDAEFAAFHPVLYEAYATRGRWARALEFGAPEATELTQQLPYNRIKLARAFAGRGDWDQVIACVNAAEVTGELRAEARYWQGRALAAQGQTAEAIPLLEEAAGTFPPARFHLGLALEAAGRPSEAIVAWLQVPVERPEYPVALGRAWLRMQETGDAATQDVLESLREALRQMETLPEASQAAGNAPALRAFAVSPDAAAEDGAFPALFLWGGGEDEPSSITGVARIDAPGEHQLRLLGTTCVLQLRNVTNRAPWASIERAYPTDRVVPGWIDTARDWFDLRATSSARVADDGGENLALLVEPVAWILSAPAQLPVDRPCLLAGRLRDPEGHGRVGWQSLDAESAVLRGGALASCETLVDWTLRAAVIPPEPGGAVVRVILENTAPGSVYFDDLLLLELSPPDPETP